MAPRWIPVGLVVLPFTLICIPASCAQAICLNIGRGLISSILGSKAKYQRRKVILKDAQCQTDDDNGRSLREEEQESSTEELLNELIQDRTEARHELGKVQSDLQMANARNDLLENFCKAGESDLRNLMSFVVEVQPILQLIIQKIKIFEPMESDLETLKSALDKATHILEMGQQNNWDMNTSATLLGPSASALLSSLPSLSGFGSLTYGNQGSFHISASTAGVTGLTPTSVTPGERTEAPDVNRESNLITPVRGVSLSFVSSPLDTEQLPSES
eukprot:CAMPEP_0175083324 /NCGR_PEP_ID=MMETSP0052_2-20121109/27310_1 /TAXON_ID=51329 ORGANISM="Polytomella parva, Strain SAG 63-3" /NCGR_SAMPLE_ID=MMETSP0052_2 /ASSEMBLY_ACC=CAM_ASM_000194 /LENGTH=273 /DNA_ID=CAMNT_0016354743 /DNA_START=253 /DNA_END=1077 /DNA_ORIENTATION=-